MICEIWKSEFKQNCDLNHRISMVHNENVPFRCNFYEKDLIHESPLNKHKSSVHERKKHILVKIAMLVSKKQ